MNSFADANVNASISAEREIGRLISTYSYLLDSGKFDEVAKLLKHATLEVPGATAEGEADIEKFLISGVQRHEDGTPRTWHAVSNMLIDVDVEQGSATSKSYFTVHQELKGFPLQAICAGHYHDTFCKLNGSWHFVRRAVTAHLMGDLKFHVGGLSSDTAS
ncbi:MULTISPECIES: nuclear transport factor 2 family protein [unclassified Pseudomonas]|uniref:nuclear transport factor 2 family protein n=1 Tax=unclassified Pseudomonas TaxID=196821 RepID=UPI000D34F382|nr:MULTISPECIES: nuclear transport factor 2 family protein [unclassified Pseudomonas]RAU43849.1 nuclear transport factor 2 family protein [Pseudomonas sp. RIT 409]RAU56257.1 nuclear transport factor 2 family protein [Pseudomonas sp. RIT 412]